MSTRFFALSRSFAGAAAAVVLVGLLSSGPAAAAPTAAPSSPAAAGARASGVAAPSAGRGLGTSTSAVGSLVVQLDPATLQATPIVRGTMCRLSVGVTLTLSGTVDGAATGVTTATISAPCAQATSTPPGTFADTFRFTGDFAGEVSGVPATAVVEYAGVTRAGGDVAAVLILHGGATVLASVQARAGAEGTYRGVAL